MGERLERIEVSHDSLHLQDHPPADNAGASVPTRSGIRLLRESIDDIERLRQDYEHLVAIIDRLWQQLTQHQAELDQHLADAIALLSQIEECSQDAEKGSARAPLLLLHAQTLGRFGLTYQGKPIPLGSSRKGQAILRYLITRSNRRAGDDVLLDLFWPGEPQDRAKHKLHIAISKLRLTMHQALLALLPGPLPPPLAEALEHCILFEEDSYCLNPAIQIQVDAEIFAAHFRAGEHLHRSERPQAAIREFRAAIDLYQGDFLTKDLYADWAIGPRARMEEMYLTLLGHLANDHFAHQEYEQSIACCRQILERDSFREDAYRQLMRCYSRMGRRNQALREYATCAQVLQQELGVHPMRETVELYDRIASEQSV